MDDWAYVKTNKVSCTGTVQNIIRLPFLVLAFVWRKKIPQSIPRTKRIKFIRNSGDSNRFGAILDFSLYSDFSSFVRRHILFVSLQSCAILCIDFGFFRGKIQQGRKTLKTFTDLKNISALNQPTTVDIITSIFSPRQMLRKFMNY